MYVLAFFSGLLIVWKLLEVWSQIIYLISENLDLQMLILEII